MVEIEEMDADEIRKLIGSLSFGHLACSEDDRPYVVPINYLWLDPYIYIYTTEGRKADVIKSNPQVCLQIERIKDRASWKSVIINAVAREVDDAAERDKAVKAILKINPTLTPAISVHWIDDWVRENIEIIFCLEPTATTGRRTVPLRKRS